MHREGDAAWQMNTMTGIAQTSTQGSRLRDVLRKVRCACRRPEKDFWSGHYTRHNQRRQEHLASLNLSIAGRTVLETGAGLGDHTGFFLDRGCNVIVTDARPENLRRLRQRLPSCQVEFLDLDRPPDQGDAADDPDLGRPG